MGPIQAALYGALTGDSTLMGLVTGIYDWVPEGTATPYVVIGETIATPRNAHDRFGRRSVTTIHVWSTHHGFSEINTILSRITAVLDHQPLTVTGHDAVMVHHEFTQTLNDPDPEIRHGVIRFAITTEET
jgi:hypothetical protein